MHIKERENFGKNNARLWTCKQLMANDTVSQVFEDYYSFSVKLMKFSKITFKPIYKCNLYVISISSTIFKTLSAIKKRVNLFIYFF